MEDNLFQSQAQISSPSPAPSPNPIPTKRRKKNPVELQEAGSMMKDAIKHFMVQKGKGETPEDDFDRYGKILANKLRKLPEDEGLKMMYQIDGLFINRLNSTPPSYCSRPSSSFTSYSEPISTYNIQTMDPNQNRTILINPNRQINVISNELITQSPPPNATQTELISQAFYEA